MDITIGSSTLNRDFIIADSGNENPNLSAAEKFISALSADGNVTFQTFDDSPVKERWFSRVLHGTLLEHADELTQLNEQGAGVFVMVNEGDFEGRAAGNVVQVRSIFADFDKVALPQHFALPPHMIVQSSPSKYHVYWLIDGVPKNDFAALQKNLAKIYGTDSSVNDLPRVMRLPGFYHCKGEPVMTQLLEAHNHAPYTYAEILKAFPLPTKKEKQAAPEGDNAGSTDKLSPRKIIEHMLGNFSVDDGRNNYGFKVACQIRDNGYSQDECRDAMLKYYLPVVEDLIDPHYTKGEMLVSIKQAYKQKPRDPWAQQENYEHTEAGNAERLLDKHGSRFVYVSEARAYYAYDGKRWIENEGAVYQYALDAVRNLKADIVALEDKLEEAVKESDQKDLKKQIVALKTFIKSSSSFSGLTGIINLARTYPGVTVKAEIFDTHPFLLNVQNGTVDLRIGTLRPHDPGDYHTRIASDSYIPAATCPKWLKFQADISAINGTPDLDMVSCKQKLWGYTLTGETSEQKVMFAYSNTGTLDRNGSNGKSTELETVQHIMGDYAKTVPFDTFASKRENAPTYALADLSGIRFVYASEGEQGAKLSEAVLKQVTDKRISARQIYEKNREYPPQFKVWLATNHLPVIKGMDNGTWRRLLPLDYAARFDGKSRILNYGDVLLEESVGILAWLVQGAVQWYQNGLGTMPQRVESNLTHYKSNMDTFGSFLEDECELDSSSRVEKVVFQKSYNEWAKTFDNSRTLSAHALKLVMTERGFTEQASNGKRYWLGVKLRCLPFESQAAPHDSWA